MRPRRLLYRADGVEVWRTAHLQDGGRLTLVYQVWCVAVDCQDRGRLDACRDPGQAIRVAAWHRHRLTPTRHHRERGRARALLALAAGLFVGSFLLAATWAALLIHPLTVPAP